MVLLLHEEKEPIEWMSLYVGAERGVNCEHMQGLLTNLLQKHWEWQENRRKDLEPGKFFKYKTVYSSKLGCVKTAFDVAKPSVVSKILSTDWYPRSRGGRFASRDAGRERVGMLRDLRDGITFVQVHTAGRSGGICVVGVGG